MAAKLIHLTINDKEYDVAVEPNETPGGRAPLPPGADRHQKGLRHGRLRFVHGDHGRQYR